MKHKRKRPWHQRAGCALCKGHKDERETKTARGGNAKRDAATKADLRDPEGFGKGPTYDIYDGAEG